MRKYQCKHTACLSHSLLSSEIMPQKRNAHNIKINTRHNSIFYTKEKRNNRTLHRQTESYSMKMEFFTIKTKLHEIKDRYFHNER